MAHETGVGSSWCEGKVAVVTGARGLLGRAVCGGLRAAGATVWAADIADPGSGDRMLTMDVTSESSCRESLDAVISEEGGLDVLVNCAYPRTTDWGAALAKESLDSWRTNLGDHLGGYFAASREAAERMAPRGEGPSSTSPRSTVSWARVGRSTTARA